jgi:hypothetical protein
MPTPVDLVTDLPADFEVFGQAVDSSMADLLGGTTGQVLAKNSNTNMDFVWTGAWTTYTPTFTGLTVGNGTLVARYCQVGKLVSVMIRLTFGSTTSIPGGFVQFGLPIVSGVSSGGVGNAYLLDSGTADYPAICKQDSISSYSLNPILANGTYASLASMTGTVPFTWTTNDVIQITLNYEAA